MISLRTKPNGEQLLHLQSLLLFLSFYGKNKDKIVIRDFFQSVEEASRSADLLDLLYQRIALKPAELERECLDLRRLLNEKRIDYLSVLDEGYPPLLREIVDYPLGLFYRGDPELLLFPCVSVVGSRKPTYDGAKICDLLAKHFHRKKIAVLSGLAFGIDALIHSSCLQRGVRTVAVLPSSVDKPIPVSNLKIADAILQKGGLLVSEHPPGYRVKPASYVERNRIISGISDRTLIVEAALRSGSMSTAGFAIEQNRDLYAMPGSISNPVAEGCNYLIAQGAKVLCRAEDFYEFPREEFEEAPERCELDSLENFLLKILSAGGRVDLDEVLSKAKGRREDVLAKLIEMELSGYIRRNGQSLELL